MAKEEKEIALKHINLDPRKDIFVKPRGFGGSKNSTPPIEIDKFKQMINNLEQLQAINLYNRQWIYFVILLSEEYHTSGVQNMLKEMYLELISVLDDIKILVKGDKRNLANFLEKDKINLSIRKYIVEMKALDNQEKIGESLRKLIKEDVDNKNPFRIVVQTIDSSNSEERIKIAEELKKYLGDEFKQNIRLGTFSCISNSKQIKTLSSLPFIKIIALQPTSKSSSFNTPCLVNEFKKFIIAKPEEDYGVLCILDTGVSSVNLRDYISGIDCNGFANAEDILGHGTKVASVAIFGTDLLFKKQILRPKCKILNFKIAHDDAENVEIDSALIAALDKYGDSIFVYNLSYNYIFIEENYRIELAERLDKIIQEKNLFVINSGGNIDLTTARNFNKNSEEYLTKFPCYSPAEVKSIFSVGSICKTSNLSGIKISTTSRLTVHPLFLENEIERRNYIKPDANTFGGNNLLEIERGDFKHYPDLEFPVINKEGEIIYDFGSSLASPLIAQSVLKLRKEYPQFKNCETYKAIILNNSVIHNYNGQNLFSLIDIDKIGYCNNSIFLNFEGVSKPHQRKEDDKQKNCCECFSVEFYMPPEAGSIDIVAVHSNNYKFRKLDKQNTRLVIKVIKGNGRALAKDFGNLGQFSQVLYGTYTFKRNFEGNWKIQVYIETKGIPSELTKEVLVRWGISLKINFSNISKEELKEIYEKIRGIINKEVEYESEAIPLFEKMQEQAITA